MLGGVASLLCYISNCGFFFFSWSGSGSRFSASYGGGLGEWTKRGCSRYIFLGCSILLQPFDFSRVRGNMGTENKQNGTWSSLTCIIFLSFFLFSFLGFNDSHSHCRCIFCIMWVGSAYSMWARRRHHFCGNSLSLSLSLYFYRTVLLAS